MPPLLFLLLGLLVFVGRARDAAEWPQYGENPFVFPLAQPRADETAGGTVAADVNNDGLWITFTPRPAAWRPTTTSAKRCG